jgi:tetratricopeptide (TPR) repeat protein
MTNKRKYWMQFAILVFLLLCFIPIVRANNSTAVEWFKKGNDFRKTGQNEEALDAYNLALSFDQDYTEAWSNKGTVLDRLGQYQEALDSYDIALSLNQNYSEALSNKGNTLYHLGLYQDALDAVNKSLSINPDLAPAWNFKGLILQHLNRRQEALDAYNKALSINPDLTAAQKNREILLTSNATQAATNPAAPAQKKRGTPFKTPPTTNTSAFYTLGIKPIPTGIGFSILAVCIGLLIMRRKI